MFFKKEKNRTESQETSNNEIMVNHTEVSNSAPQAANLSKPAEALATLGKQEFEDKIIQMLKTCYDPEIPVDIFELGLIYEIKIDDDSNINIKMTLTSPACPVAGSLPGEVETKIKSIPEVKDINIELVWDPPWDRDMMSDIAKIELGMY